MTHQIKGRRFLGQAHLDAGQAHAINPVAIPHPQMRRALHGEHLRGQGGTGPKQQGADQGNQDGAQQGQSLAPQLGQNRWALAVLLPQLPH